MPPRPTAHSLGTLGRGDRPHRHGREPGRLHLPQHLRPARPSPSASCSGRRTPRTPISCACCAKLLALPSAATLFPELTLVDGRVALRGGGGPRLLESDQSTAPLMAWLNDTPDSVDRDEAQVAARFVDWALGYAEHRQAQVDFAVAEAKRAMAGYARRYGLDGAGDELLVAVADIRHQGRAGSAQILTALRAADPLDALLRLGAERYPTRCATLRSEIDKLRRQGRLGRLVFDAARTAWVARLDVS